MLEQINTVVHVGRVPTSILTMTNHNKVNEARSLSKLGLYWSIESGISLTHRPQENVIAILKMESSNTYYW